MASGKKENRKNETDIGGVAVIGSISDIKVVWGKITAEQEEIEEQNRSAC